MYVNGSLSGTVIPTRKFRIGATVVSGALVCQDSNYYGQIMPGSSTSYPNSVGVTYEAGTYAAASPGVMVKASYTPDQIIRGKVSGGTTNDTAFTSAQLITNTGTSTTVIACAAVGTLDYTAGTIIALDGDNKGQLRTITSQIESTSNTVTVPFGSAFVAGAKLLRIYSFGNQFLSITSDASQWDNLLTGTDTINTNPAAGFAAVFDIIFDGHRISQSVKVNVVNPTAPQVEYECVLIDHVFKSVA